jgi:hypothetical protein
LEGTKYIQKESKKVGSKHKMSLIAIARIKQPWGRLNKATRGTYKAIKGAKQKMGKVE